MVSEPIDITAERVAARFKECQPLRSLERLRRAGGFSGARLWRVEGADGQYCLRCWPVEHPRRERLAEIHRVLRFVGGQGLATLVAVPLRDRTGATFVDDGAALWELNRWLPGQADFHEFPSRERLVDAMQVLARFHLATDPLADARTGAPPGVLDRTEQLRSAVRDGFTRFFGGTAPRDWPTFSALAKEILDGLPTAARKTLLLLERASSCRVRIQPCIRDIWHDHVLFSGNRVSGLIDFGALRPDHVAGDIARLLGSLVGDDSARRQQGLCAYIEIRTLSAEERELVKVYDSSGVVLGGLNWLKWVLFENRQFEDRDRVEQRMVEIIRRLQAQRLPD